VIGPPEAPRRSRAASVVRAQRGACRRRPNQELSGPPGVSAAP